MPLLFRPARPEMLDDLYTCDVAAWGEEMAASRDMLAARMAINPGGNYVAIQKESGKIVGSVWTTWVDDRSFTTWAEATGDGMYAPAFNLFGQVLFGANISALKIKEPVGPFLLQRVTELVPTMGRQFARMGGRMPSYQRWSRLFRPEAYILLYRHADRVYLKDDIFGHIHDGGSLFELMRIVDTATEQIDPYTWPRVEWPGELVPFDFELRFFTSVKIRERPFLIKRLLPEYFPDPESMNNGVLLEWANPDYAP